MDPNPSPHGLTASRSLPEPTKKELLNLVRVTGPYDLGIRLNVDESDLDIVRVNHPTDHGRQLSDVFSLYLRQTEEPSWLQVVVALRAMGERSQANTIMKKYGIYDASPAAPTGTPQHTAAPGVRHRPREHVPWFSNLSEGERADCSSPPPVYNTSYGAPHTGSGVHKCSSYGGCCLVLLAIAALVAVGVGVMKPSTIVAIFRHEGGGPADATPPPPVLGSHQNSANPTVTPVTAEKWLTVEPTVKLMSLIQYTDSKGQERTFRLINEVQNDCRNLGSQLGIDEATLKALKGGHDSPSEVCNEVLLTWINRGEDHVTWAGLLQALDAIQMGGIGKRLREAMAIHCSKSHDSDCM